MKTSVGMALKGALASIVLIAPIALAQNPTATVNVDVNANRHVISPFIYGVAYGGSALSDLNAPLNRYGGNNSSRYNWMLNADNRDADWYFESIPDTSATPGERGDTFIGNSKTAGAQPMITIPMLDYVAKLGPNRGKLASYSIAKYGAQTGNDAQWYPDAGNGVRASDGATITWNDPLDANVTSSANDSTKTVRQRDWVHHIVTTWGTANNGGLKYYLLDNEHSIWFSTHQDVHPTGPTMAEIRQKILDYAGAIKAEDPTALVAGPEEWGWSGYFYSGYDQQYAAAHGWCCYPDRQTNGNWDYLPWLLDQLHQNEVLTGNRVLDIFTVHYYPQGGEFGNDTSVSMQQTRNRSTRSLWDPAYVDPTWIDDTVKLIPRLKGWVASYYPGLLIGITEYNWGAEGHINGATAQADIYGIFGREGLDIGTRWTTPDPSTPTYKAMKMYRNYDGAKSTFGNVSVSATGPNPDNVAAFAAQRTSDGALTIMIVSKYVSNPTAATVDLSINIANFSSSGTAQVWQLTSANAINHLPDVALSGSTLTTQVPGQSVTLFVLPAGTPNAPPVATFTAAPASGIAPLNVAFDAGASSDPDGSIASYVWAFGDGSTDSGVTTNHTYTSPGSYTATLTVTDNREATGSTSTDITATSDPNAINAPSGLTASALRKQAVTLRWTDNSSNEQGFYVERAPTGTASYVRVGQTGASVTTYTESPRSGRYTYRVQAFNATTGRVSTYSNTVSVRVR
ncbi:MAG: PKD domain-containing protein [Candidatus Methylomirabilis oxygeniifera]|uniref:Cellulase n=1 Tax=Methylomirabilis oxygeniifera TaxID=671143 RepID=D5MF13_METO1|nr:MAG: PKD domain-containing protein [Candidatus Methylomirabilis oxyfera]CBE68342.1 Cellulase [Candidatus Methylomirabilis oxyfera]